MKRMQWGAALLAMAIPFGAARADITIGSTPPPKFTPKPLTHTVVIPEDAIDDPSLQQTVLKLALYTWARSGDTVIYQLEEGSKYRFKSLSLSKDQAKWNLQAVPDNKMSASLKFAGNERNVTIPVNVTLHLLNTANGQDVDFDPMLPTLPLN